MVIDVQTGKTHAGGVMTWLFDWRCDSYPPTSFQNTKPYFCLIKLTFPPCPCPPPALVPLGILFKKNVKMKSMVLK